MLRRKRRQSHLLIGNRKWGRLYAAYAALSADGQLTNALARRRKDCVAQRWGERRYAGLADSGGRSVAFHDIYAAFAGGPH